ncbi:formate dehydrogenase subunit delta [Sporichthya polymorpha]|uniref:formate dehydrogenase subunit delta n=1 Tax=Sporichthya polymorpha TaxID=35751 RepID=UPI00035C33E5|nr:formate dehydrogenase subunit delta [Sporichthya polymorpha]
MSEGTIRPEVRLAGEIADQFRHKPQDVAAEAIASHIRMFWDPRMRTTLLAAESAGEVDDSLVRAAVERLRA